MHEAMYASNASSDIMAGNGVSESGMEEGQAATTWSCTAVRHSAIVCDKQWRLQNGLNGARERTKEEQEQEQSTHVERSISDWLQWCTRERKG